MKQKIYAKDFTIADMARAIDARPETISRWCASREIGIKPESWRKLVDVLKLSTGDISEIRIGMSLPQGVRGGVKRQQMNVAFVDAPAAVSPLSSSAGGRKRSPAMKPSLGE